MAEQCFLSHQKPVNDPVKAKDLPDQIQFPVWYTGSNLSRFSHTDNVEKPVRCSVQKNLCGQNDVIDFKQLWLQTCIYLYTTFKDKGFSSTNVAFMLHEVNSSVIAFIHCWSVLFRYNVTRYRNESQMLKQKRRHNSLRLAVMQFPCPVLPGKQLKPSNKNAFSDCLFCSDIGIH